jgi:folylpolyglutamate synthase/dihydropteroate synthase
VEAFFATPLAGDVVAEGFAAVTMPGRFEVMGHQPLVVVDGAHNPPGADTCAQVFLDDFQPEGRRVLVVGTLRDPASMLAALRADEFDLVVACTAPSPRGVPVAKVAAAARELGCDEVLAYDTVTEACAAAVRHADGDDAVLAVGSLYVAGEARSAFQRLLT